MQSGYEGSFRCSSCGWWYEYQLFDDRVACYADKDPPGESSLRGADSDPGLLDYNDDKPFRADGFLSPIREDEIQADRRITALLALADSLPDPKPAFLMRNFLGSFACKKCGKEGPLKKF